MPSTFTPDRRGMGRFLTSPQMRAAMVRIMTEVKTDAVANTPVGSGEDGGHVRDHYKVASVRKGGVHGDRAEAWCYNDHRAAIPYEVGFLSQNGRPVPGHGTLARALDRVKHKRGMS